MPQAGRIAHVSIGQSHQRLGKPTVAGTTKRTLQSRQGVQRERVQRGRVQGHNRAARVMLQAL